MVENVEKRKIVEAMERTKGNKSRAAEMLGLSRLGLRKKMERYGIASD
jgi:DNA-binding protein Fis